MDEGGKVWVRRKGFWTEGVREDGEWKWKKDGREWRRVWAGVVGMWARVEGRQAGREVKRARMDGLLKYFFSPFFLSETLCKN